MISTHHRKRLLSFVSFLGLRIGLGPTQEFFTDRYGRHIIRLNASAKALLLDEQQGYVCPCPGPVKDENGRTFCCDLFGVLLHELGHYLIAPKGRRHRRDYGIPSEGRQLLLQFLSGWKPRSERSPRRWDEDELKAILVQNYLREKFGGLSLEDPLRYNTKKDLLPKVKAWWKQEGQRSIDAHLARFNKQMKRKG